jgi:hypothetical protein
VLLDKAKTVFYGCEKMARASDNISANPLILVRNFCTLVNGEAQ